VYQLGEMGLSHPLPAGDPRVFVSVHSVGVEVLCFDTVLQVFILQGIAINFRFESVVTAAEFHNGMIFGLC
jgi:hypothetical protein